MPAALALVAVVLLLYLPSMTAGFVWDDDETLTANPLVHASDGLSRLWLTTCSGAGNSMAQQTSSKKRSRSIRITPWRTKASGKS